MREIGYWVKTKHTKIPFDQFGVENPYDNTPNVYMLRDRIILCRIMRRSDYYGKLYLKMSAKTTDFYQYTYMLRGELCV